MIDSLGLDLLADVVNWEAVKPMQVAFLRAGVPDQDLVQDTEDKEDVAATDSYGLEFDPVVSRGNIHGVQCHPYK